MIQRFIDFIKSFFGVEKYDMSIGNQFAIEQCEHGLVVGCGECDERFKLKEAKNTQSAKYLKSYSSSNSYNSPKNDYSTYGGYRENPVSLTTEGHLAVGNVCLHDGNFVVNTGSGLGIEIGSNANDNVSSYSSSSYSDSSSSSSYDSSSSCSYDSSSSYDSGSSSSGCDSSW